ncbi:MAG: hypothetical protein H3C38_08365 [Rhodospirillales bacterium]|nr:hypothetical protein [Rhodospirillales bacterium]
MRLRQRRWFKVTAISTGVVVLAIGLVLGPLPGPTGLPVMFVGSVIILRHSSSARRWYILLGRRWPRLVGAVDRVLRRRRHARRRAALQAAAE